MKFKKIVGLLFLVVCCFPTLFVSADELCTTYRNYYFFNEINSFDVVKNKVTENSGVWQRNHVTYFPNVHKVTEEQNMKSGKVCLADETGCNETWTLEEFYNKYKEIMSKGEKGNVTISNKEEEYIVYTVTDDDGKEVSYFLHSAWFETDENGNVITDSRSENVDYSSVDTADLVKGSFIPVKSLPNLDFTGGTNGEGYVEATIGRRIETADYESVTPFSLEWNSTSGSIQSVLTPALYYSEYELCGKEVKYDATINYYKEGTTEKVADTWSKSNLEDGYTETVSSPTVENCTPGEESVNVLIDGDNFDHIVYYTCNVEKNPGTGSAFIFFVAFICLATLGVGAWYYKKSNVNN